MIGWAWLSALHARSAIARDRRWQALQMIEGLRDRIVTLACLRHGLPAVQGRGMDRLPHALLRCLDQTLVAALQPEALATALTAATELLLSEVDHLDPVLAGRLGVPWAELTTSLRIVSASRTGGT